MRATLPEISPTPSARTRSLTRVKRPSRKGRNTSPREPFPLVGRCNDVINLLSKASVTRQECRIDPQGSGSPPYLRANWLRCGSATPGKEGGWKGCRSHLPRASSTRSPPPLQQSLSSLPSSVRVATAGPEQVVPFVARPLARPQGAGRGRVGVVGLGGRGVAAGRPSGCCSRQ